MTPRDPRLRAALAAALTAALGAGCALTPGRHGPDTGPDTATPQHTGTVPDSLEEICATSLLPQLTPGAAVDFIAMRRIDGFDGDGARVEVETVGTACATASDRAGCEAALAEAWPTGTGYGYCGEGCSDSGLAYTRGDEVAVVDSPDEAAAFLYAVDTLPDALYIALTTDHQPDCATSRVQGDGSFTFEASFLTSDCPWTTENRLVHVSVDGVLDVVEVLSVDESGVCAGRRPEGLVSRAPVEGDAVARHLAELAHLEAAAVVAFERFAADLERLGAPAALVRRALDAAGDEVRHAEAMGKLARSAGVETPPVVVAEHVERDLLAFALENAVEGCVRETYGAADAAWRAARAPAPLRSVFAAIADDEARHAELSWDVHRWAWARLDTVGRDALVAAMASAHAGLAAQAAASTPAIEQALGAPSPAAAAAMIDALRTHLG